MTVLENIYQADLRLLLWCRKSRSFPRFMALIRGVSRTGDGYMQVLFPCTFWLLSPASGLSFILLVVTAFAIERPLYFVLKNSLKRRRPPEALPDFTSIVQASDKFSFPSGHTMAAFLLAGLAVSTLGAVASPLYIWASFVGISRVLLGVHFPTDILAGATLGSLITYFMVTT